VPLIKHSYLLICLFLIVARSYAEQITVTDGDTIRIGDERIRFSGIDAPELKQTCIYKSIEFQCGEFSKNLLIKKIANEEVTCIRQGKDQYGRTLAECFVGEDSLSSYLVREGYAFAYRQYSDQFIQDEEYAQIRENGMWSMKFLFPWEYRRQK
jgi:endonuclease YncB( thermonuclease family)